MEVLKMNNAQLLPQIVEYVNEGHTVTLLLNGYSMRPFLENGRDKGLLAKPEGVKVGDPVLALTDAGKYVLHRVVDIAPDGSITLRGDGNIGCEHCGPDGVKASVIGFYRKGRNKLDRTDGWKWKIYSFFWMKLLPIRRYLLFIYRGKLKLTNSIKHLFYK